jgi:hypothetical protein
MIGSCSRPSSISGARSATARATARRGKAITAPSYPRKGGQRSAPAECLRRSESGCGGAAAQRPSGWGMTGGRVLCEALLKRHLDRLL